MGEEVGRSVGVADLTRVRTCVARARVDRVEGEQATERGAVAVEEPDVEQLAAFTCDESVDDELDRVDAGFVGQIGDRATALDLVVGLVAVTERVDELRVVPETLARPFGQEVGAGCVVTQSGDALLGRGQHHQVTPVLPAHRWDLREPGEGARRTGHAVAGDPARFGPGLAEEAVPEIDHPEVAAGVVARADREDHVAGPFGHRGQQAELIARARVEVEHGLEDPTAGIVHAVGQCQVLGVRREGAGNVPPVRDDVLQQPRRRVADSSAGDRLGDDLTHAAHLVLSRLLVSERPVPHHLIAHRAVTDEGDDIERGLEPLHRIEVLGVRLPVPREAAEDRLTWDVLHALHHLGEIAAVLGDRRCERHAAVPHQHRRHPVPGARRHERIPPDLGVHVRVQIDEPGRHGQARRVDLARCDRVREVADGGDAIAVHRDVGAHRTGPGPVDDGPASDDQVVRHGCSREVA